MQPLPDDRTILALIEPLALAAGKRTLEVWRQGVEVAAKADASPVTQADREAEEIILAGLRAAFPGVPIVAEEEVSAGLGPDAADGSAGDIFFLVDPLDGTREFVRGGDDYTVNIALVRGGAPAVGVVYAPARNMLYTGRPGLAEAVATDADHRPRERRAIAARPAGTPPTIVASRSHNTPETDAFIARHAPAERVSVGSSLKFCLLAAGEADLYPRFGRTMQWDTAAGDAVLRAAGGQTRALDDTPLPYGPGTCPDDAPFANPHFIAQGQPSRPEERGEAATARSN